MEDVVFTLGDNLFKPTYKPITVSFEIRTSDERDTDYALTLTTTLRCMLEEVLKQADLLSTDIQISKKPNQFTRTVRMIIRKK